MVTSLFFSIPLAALFAFPCNLEIAGLWLGLDIGLFVLSFYFAYLLLVRYDWNVIADKC